MNYIIELFNKKIQLIEKEIFYIEETIWMTEYLDSAINDVKNIKNHMLTLCNILPFDDYVNLENQLALIEVHLRKNQNKISFDYDKAYNNIKNLLKSKNNILKENINKINILRENIREYKEVLYDIKYNDAISIKKYEFILSNINDIDNNKKANILNELGFYNKKREKNNEIDILINSDNFNLEKVARFETSNNNKRNLIYSVVVNIYEIIKQNNLENIEDTLCDCFDSYMFENEEKALFTSLLLEKIYNEVEDLKKMFLDDGFYIDKSSSHEIINNCNQLKNAYEKIKSMYDGYTTIVELEEKRELCFSYFNNQSDKPRVYDDIESYINANTIDDIQIKHTYNLLNDYINKNPKVIFESLTGKNGFYKIKYHGRSMTPRFILEKVDGKMIFVGFFLKHDQKGDRDYGAIVNRIYSLNQKKDEKSLNEILGLLESKMSKKR